MTAGRDRLKRILDLTLASCSLAVLSPLLVVFALLIKWDSPGPVFFRGERIGQYGKRFRIFKFRTMVCNADRIGGFSTADTDPRITRIGRFLRKRKIDELPQLINVLRGEMSLVGPRPEVAFYVEMYTDEEKEILAVRPGITDWASLSNPDEGMILAGSPDPEKTYMEKIRPNKLRLQLAYVRNRSLSADAGILLRTMGAVIGVKKHPRNGTIERSV